MILEVCWDGLWTLSCGLSQFHGHGSQVVCEVALVQMCDMACAKEGANDKGSLVADAGVAS